MAESPQKTPPPEELHWGIAYLRADIQDVRGAIIRLDAKIDDVQRAIREQNTVLTQRAVMLTGLMTTVLLAAMKL